MEDRKLYHLINGEFVRDGMPSVHIPTYEEMSAHIEILCDVGFFDSPITESVTFDGIGDGKRNTEVQASVYDAMMAEIIRDHNTEKELHRKHRNAERYRKAQSQVYRNRSGKSAKELPKCYTRGHDSDAGYWRNWKAYCEMKSRTEWKQDNAEKSIRKDYEVEQDNNYAEICDAEYLREQIDAEVIERDRVIKFAERKIDRMKQIVENLRSMELPTDWESLYEFTNNVDWLYEEFY